MKLNKDSDLSIGATEDCYTLRDLLASGLDDHGKIASGFSDLNVEFERATGRSGAGDQQVRALNQVMFDAQKNIASLSTGSPDSFRDLFAAFQNLAAAERGLAHFAEIEKEREAQFVSLRDRFWEIAKRHQLL